MKKLLFFVLAMVLPTMVLRAQDDPESSDDLFEMSLEDLLNVEISSASKVSQKVSEAPSVISIISRKQIQNYGWVSTNDILYRLPGFSPSQDYDRRTVSSRGQFEGWNNNHYLMLVDGIPMNDNLYGTAFTSEVTPLVFTKNLEVIRGPGSALYGSNATNGVITLNTISASDLNGVGEGRFRIGTQGTRIYDVIVGGENEKVSVVSAFNAYTTNGNEYFSRDDSKDTSGVYLDKKSRVNDNRSNYYFFNKIEGKGRLKGLSLQYHEQHWQYETGHGWLFNIPDQPESMKEFRRLASLKYAVGGDSKLGSEFIVRYQIHGLDWNMRFFPDHSKAYDIYFPQGVSEYLRTKAEDVFARAQFSYKITENSVLLGGVENTLFIYGGDDAHNSNIALNNDFSPYPNNEFKDMGSWMAFVDGKKVNTTGIFAQYQSPKLIGGKLQATLGARYDIQFFDYYSIYEPGSPEKSKNFDQFSPRLGLVFIASDNLTFKGLAGRAFRTPSPTEMFGANTFTLASNIEGLNPEIITTFELAADWTLSKQLNLRVNGYYNDFQNQIGYSVANANLSTNIYSLVTAGFETDLQYSFGDITGFANYSFSQRLDENIQDNTIAPSKDGITWVPASVANIGFTYKKPKFYASPILHYQGKVLRRATDVTPTTQNLRPAEIKAWTSIDLKIAYTPTNNIDIGIVCNNLLNQKNYLIKNNAFTLDYRGDAMRVMLDLKFRF